MFKVQASYQQTIKVTTDAETARAFFSNPRSFLELMPGVEAIETLPDDTRRWTISASVPVIGKMRQHFIVCLAEDTPQYIEWIPATNANGNLLKYSARFETIDDKQTRVTFNQQTQVQRASAKELHTFAGWVGEAKISQEMQRGVDAMMREFLMNAQKRLNE